MMEQNAKSRLAYGESDEIPHGPAYGRWLWDGREIAGRTFLHAHAPSWSPDGRYVVLQELRHDDAKARPSPSGRPFVIDAVRGMYHAPDMFGTSLLTDMRVSDEAVSYRATLYRTYQEGPFQPVIREENVTDFTIALAEIEDWRPLGSGDDAGA